MGNKKFVGIFHSIDAVLYEVAELKAGGYSESDIYAFSRKQDNISMLRDQTSITLYSANKFDKFLSGKERTHDGFITMGFSEEESAHLYDKVGNNGIALFIDNKDENQSSEADSSAEIDRSGESLDNQENDEQVTSPRMNTENL